MLEREAASRLNMSRTPVREAMVQLERDGLVRLRPRHGMQVLPLSASDMNEIYEVLGALEAVAVERLARRGLTRAEHRMLRDAVADMTESLRQKDLRGWAEADNRFHELLTVLPGNRRMQKIAERLNEQVRRARTVTLTLRPLPTDSTRDHALLVAAIAQGDPDKARKLHWAHRTRTGRLLTTLIGQLGLKQI